ncbi:MAG TPA: tetratricopeptide repeat protein [Candidatus Binataceae bacterium]|nr:tetratricopeptide repeat protein [Candidatus Binataceae bacterium]
MAPKKHKRGATREAARAKSPGAPNAEMRTSSRGSSAIFLAGALGATFIAYLRCLGNGFVYDDHEMIIINPMIGQWSFLWRSFAHDVWWFRPNGEFPKSSYYRPLEDVWLALNYHAFGLNPAPWHLTSVLLQLVVVVAVYRIAVALTADVTAGLLAAVLFGLFPAHADSIVWPSANVLAFAAAFELGALYYFITRASGSRRLFFSMLLFGGALLSHESAVLFPVLVAAYTFILDGGEEPVVRAAAPSRMARALKVTAPYFAEAIAYLGLRLWVLGFITRPAPHNQVTWLQAAYSIPAGLAHYLVMLVAPWMAGPAHEFHPVSSAASAQFYLPVLGLAALAAAMVLIFASNSHRRLYVFLAVWAATALAPVLDFRNLVTDALIQDRYAYMASAAGFIFLGDLAARFAAAGAERRQLVAAAALTLAGVYALVLWHAEGYWHDDVTLFGRCIEVFPGSAACHGRLGLALQATGDLAGAEREFKRTLQINPVDGVTLYNLGLLHERLGRPAEAADEMARALDYLPGMPASSYLKLAALADQAGDSARVAQALARAAANPAAYDSAQFLRAQIMSRHGDYADAEQILDALVARRRDVAPAWAVLGAVLGAEGRGEESLQALRRAVALQPSNAQFRLALAQGLHSSGHDAEALDQCQRVLAVDPANVAARALAAQIGAGMAGSKPLPPNPGSGPIN